MPFQFNPFSGTLDIVPNLTGYVPYEGATETIDVTPQKIISQPIFSTATVSIISPSGGTWPSGSRYFECYAVDSNLTYYQVARTSNTVVLSGGEELLLTLTGLPLGWDTVLVWVSSGHWAIASITTSGEVPLDWAAFVFGSNPIALGLVTAATSDCSTFSPKGISVPSITMPTGAVDGYVLTSSSDGEASWAEPVPSLDTTAGDARYLKLDQTSPQTATGVFNITPRLAVDVNRYGFLNQTETNIAFDGTSVFTLSDVGSGWSYYRAGIKYTISGNKTINLLTVENPLVDGRLYYIYIDSTTGALSAATSSWTLIDTKVPVATILWNNTLTPKYWISDERHSCLIDRRQHYIEHFTEGCKIKTRGALTGYTLDTDTNAAKTFQIAETIMLDEDIIHTEAYLPDPNGTATDYVVFYRTAASTWKWKASNMPFAYNIGNTNNYIQYDSSGTMTDAATAKWVNSYLLVTNIEGAARYTIIMGQAEFGSLATAQAESPATFTLTGFPVVEAAFMYRLTWKVNTSYTSQGHTELDVDPVALALAAVSTVGSGASIDHGSLQGLLDNDHPQYPLLDQTTHQTFTNSPFLKPINNVGITEITYDGDGNVSTITDANGTVKTIYYNVDVVDYVEITHSDATMITKTFGYDGDDNLTYITVT